ncbi:MAG: transporter permease [Labilithrix sp.]|nr:transporter permease [Labilithrix sp.]
MSAASTELPALTPREIAALVLSIALVPLNSTMLAVAIPTIAKDLSVATEALTQGLVASYLLVGIVLQSPGGKLGDGIGHGRALGLGQLVFAAGAIVGFAARTMLLLELSRGLMAAGGAVMVPSAFALVRSRAPEKAQARAFGAFGAVMGLAAAVGPLVGGEIVARLGWPYLFVVNAPPVLFAMLLARSSVKEPRRAMPRFDVLGSALLGVGLVLAVLGLRSQRWALVFAGVVVLVVFFGWERRAANPVIDPSLFRTRAFAAGVSVVGLQNLAMYALLFELPVLLSRAFGSDAKTSGRTLLALTLAMVAGSLSGSRLAARLGARGASLVGSMVALSGMLYVGWQTPSGASDLVPGLLLLGVGIGLSTPAVQTVSMAAVDRTKSGMAAGVSSTARYLGGVIGVGVVSTLLAGSVDPLAAHKTAAHVLAVVLLIAIVASAALPSPARET